MLNHTEETADIYSLGIQEMIEANSDLPLDKKPEVLIRTGTALVIEGLKGLKTRIQRMRAGNQVTHQILSAVFEANREQAAKDKANKRSS
ncbi:MAG: hypothetical protein MRY72_02095 [Aquisalinus sp.]|nr:hypothetical protein [Aquisalinus sp.]